MSNNYEVNATTEKQTTCPLICTWLAQTTPDSCNSGQCLCLWLKCALNPVAKQRQKLLQKNVDTSLQSVLRHLTAYVNIQPSDVCFRQQNYGFSKLFVSMSKSRVIDNVLQHKTFINKHRSPLFHFRRNVWFAICHLSSILKRKSVQVETTTSIAQFYVFFKIIKCSCVQLNLILPSSP